MTILNMIQNLRNPVLDQIMLFFTTLGNGGIIWIIIALLFILGKNYRGVGIIMIISLILCLIFGNGVLKNLFERPRPSWINKSIDLIIKNPVDYSFPSGHTFAGFAAATSIYLVKGKKSIPFFILAAVIAFSRLYLYVHFLSDVIGGIIFGSAMAIAAKYIFDRYISPRYNRYT